MLVKSISAKLCSSVSGQAVMDVVVNPPKPGEPSYKTFKKVTVLPGSVRFGSVVLLNVLGCQLTY